ncbi:ABC transporter permease [Nitrospirillum viridazoti]|uniref:Octopine/nopaline transport system permease protein n=1 Tax=Nitrospirillum amazonense TaxID=28077 RepID=A0A560HM94_9PROT|nr:ABC transporter permease subunit [Nitrospirillum amazonense]TWB47658.1 octopine/nopaline transport system permease protein [Nitrospirillum amazonense]
MEEHLTFIGSVTAQLARAVPVTLLILAVSGVCATVLATGLTAMSVARSPLPRLIQRTWTFLFRGTPLILQIFMIYYGFAMVPWIRHGILWTAFRDPVFCTCLAMTCCCSAYIAEIFRGALAAVPRGEIEAGRACGMTGFMLLRRVIAPSLIRIALPSYSNEIIMMTKSTSLASTITVLDITGVAQQVIAHSYRTLDVFCAAAALYLLINATLSTLLTALERRLDVDRAPTPLAPIPPTLEPLS